MADQEFLASFGGEIDETSQSGWQGTLTFTQYTPAVGGEDERQQLLSDAHRERWWFGISQRRGAAG